MIFIRHWSPRDFVSLWLEVGKIGEIKIMSGFSLWEPKKDFKLWQEKLKIKFLGFKSEKGNLSKSEKCTPSALIFCARIKSFPTRIFRPLSRAKLEISCAKTSLSFGARSYSRIITTEFFGRFLITFVKSETFLRSVKKNRLKHDWKKLNVTEWKN